MHGLERQLGAQRLEQRLCLRHHPHGLGAVVEIGDDVRERGDDLAGMLEIPLDRPFEARMREVGERPHGLAREAPDRA